MKYIHNLGFYFSLDKSLQQPYIKTVWCCSNNKCSHHHDKHRFVHGKFCQDCGSLFKSDEIPCGFIYPSPHEFCAKYLNDDDVICRMMGDNAPDDIWRYNYSSSTEKEMMGNIDMNDIDVIAINLSQFDYPTRIAQFKQEDAVKEFLTVFERVYGKDKIDVHFGLLIEYN